MRASLQLALDEARACPREELARLLGDLRELEAVALARIVTPAVAAPDELLDVSEAAERMHVSRDYLYRNSGKFKFARRIGRKLLFSSAGLDQYLSKSR